MQSPLEAAGPLATQLWARGRRGVVRGVRFVGDRADLLVLDPAGLDDSLDEYAERPVAPLDNLPRMVNRSDRAVAAVFVNGQHVFGDGAADPVLGSRRTGRFLKAV